MEPAPLSPRTSRYRRIFRHRFAVAALIGVLGLSLLALEGLREVSVVEARLQTLLAASGRSEGVLVWGRPLVLRRGTLLRRVDLAGELERLGYRSVSSRRVGRGEFHRERRVLRIGRRAFRHPDLADPGGFTLIRVDRQGRVQSLQDATGRTLESVRLEPERLGLLSAAGGIDRRPVPLESLPKHLVTAVLELEDRRFFAHSGLDPQRIVAAFVADLRAARIVEGGSTLTQQLVKNLYLSRKRSWLRKAREAALAWTLERRHSKREILEAYLNEIFLGQRGGVAIHGVEAAARQYFGRPARELGLAESALLAGILRGPSLYSPDRHPAAARKRRNLALQVLLDRGEIDRETFEGARSAPLGVRSPSPRLAPYFMDQLRSALSARDRAGSQTSVRVPAELHTSLDPRLQRAAELAVRETLDQLARKVSSRGVDGSRLQAALVALDPKSGEVLAWVGGRDYGRSQFDRVSAMRRQPGSAFKPIVALAALARRGARPPSHTLVSRLEDEALSVPTAEGRWEPVNYDHRFRGPVSLRRALEQSLNVPFARLGEQVGSRRIIWVARRLGITTPLYAVPSLALGASEVSPLQLAGAYAVLASAGVRHPLRMLRFVVDREGGVERPPSVAAERVFRADEVFLVTDALRGVIDVGTGHNLRTLGFRGPVAGKTGTTNDYRDSWFIGYTPELVTLVWVGIDDGSPVELTGASGALPIFAHFATAVLGAADRSGFSRPETLQARQVGIESFDDRGNPACRQVREWFLEGTEPSQTCGPLSGFFARSDDYWPSREDRLADERHRRYVEGLSPDQRRSYERWRRARRRLEPTPPVGSGSRATGDLSRWVRGLLRGQ